MATNTVPTFTNHTGNGTAGPFNIGFNYIDKSEVIVRVNEVLKSTPTHYTFTSNTQITFTSGNEPASGLNIELRRSTNITTAKVDFEDGSVLTEADLDANTNQLLFALQENTDAVNADNLESSSIYLRDGSRTLTGNIVFEGSTKDAHETTLTPIDPTADRTITLPNASGHLMVSNSIVNADFGSQNIITTGSCTATNFIGDGSQLTGITAQFSNADTFDNLDSLQFVRSDVDDQVLGKIEFGDDVTFKTSIVLGDGLETSMNEIVWEAQAGKMTWDARSSTSVRGLHIEGDVPITHNVRGSNTDNRGGFTIDPKPGELEITQLLGQIKFKTAPYGLPRTVPAYTQHSNVVQWNSFAIQGTFSTDFSGDNGDYTTCDWLLLKQNTYSLGEIESANGFDQEMYLRSNDTNILKVHKNGADFLNGNIQIPNDTGKLQLGTSQDLKIYHDGNNSFIEDAGTGKLKVKTSGLLVQTTTDETMIQALENNQVELYHDNNVRAETTDSGLLITGENNSNPTLQLRNNNIGVEGEAIRLSRTDSAFRYHSITTSNSTNLADNFIKFKIHDRGGSPFTNQVTQIHIDDDKVSLSYDGTEKAVTSANGFDVTGDITCTGNIDLPDGSDIKLGDNDEFRIFHDDSNGLNYIQPHNNGPLIFKGSSGEMAKFIPGGEVILRHNNSPKLETTSSGITVTGSVTTEDMNMSNLNGTANEVDNTKGSWSIQEGADDLFIINRVSGKKYKFNLTEIN